MIFPYFSIQLKERANMLEAKLKRKIKFICDGIILIDLAYLILKIIQNSFLFFQLI